MTLPKAKLQIIATFIVVILTAIAVTIDQRSLLPIKATFKQLTPTAQKEVLCLADNILFEAGHEPREGKAAVAFVTFNRIQSGNYGDSVCEVVQQKTNGTCQFSWYCDTTFTSKRLTIKHTPLYNEILQLSTDMYLNFERIKDVTNGATYYHADYVSPGWTRLQKETQIGRHIFYKSKGDKIDRNKGII